MSENSTNATMPALGDSRSENDQSTQSKLVVTPFEKEDRSAWDAFVEQCPAASIGHRSYFAAQCWWSAVQLGGSFSLRRGGRIVGVCALAKEFRGVGAVLLGPGLALAEDEDLAVAKAALVEWTKAQGCSAVEFYLPPEAPALFGQTYPYSMLARMGFALGYGGDQTQSVVVFQNIIDLTRGADAILKGFSKGNRALVTRGKRQGYTVTFATGDSFTDSDWNAYKNIHMENCRRNGLRPFSAGRFDFLAELVRSGEAVVVNCYLDKECHCSMIAWMYKNAGYYCSGGRSATNLPGAMAFTQYAAMTWMKDRGIARYCIGSTDPTAGDKSEGVGAFKSHFGGERFVWLAGRLIVDARAHVRSIILPIALVEAGLVPAVVVKILRRLRRVSTVGLRAR